MSKVFVSHSSKDVNIVKELVGFMESLGIASNDIFCSSIEGQGVKNGSRINDDVSQAFKESGLIVYLISHNFLNSQCCMQELGASLFSDSKEFFIFKLDDVDKDELKGFINSSYKYNSMDDDGFSALYDRMEELFKLNNKHSVINAKINHLMENLKGEIDVLIDTKDKTEKELEEQYIERLKEDYEDLSLGEKVILADIYFSGVGTVNYNYTNGTVNLLVNKRFIYPTSQTAILLSLPFALDKYALKMIKKNKSILDELESIYNKLKNKRR